MERPYNELERIAPDRAATDDRGDAYTRIAIN